MKNNHFIPYHINASADDLAGNDGIGRYILLPGSNGRAQEISQTFDNVTVKSHPRGHNLYLGAIQYEGKSIDVATVASGMGCPSMEIILHELFMLGGKRFLRVGTAGSLQSTLKIGDIVSAQASVRDEQTTQDYVPLSVPAVASFEYLLAIHNAANKLGLSDTFHTGTVHCKSSLFAREFGEGPNAQKNKDYLDILKQSGVLASEMETSALFIQSQIYNHMLMQKGEGPEFRVLCGAILGIVELGEIPGLTTKLISLALETIKALYSSEV